MSPLSLPFLPFLFFFFLFSNFFSLTQSSNYNTSSLIYKTCKTSSDQDPNISLNFCLTSLQPAMATAKHRHGAIDLRGLGLISLRLVRRNASSTRHHIKKLRRNKGLGAFVKLCLADCLELYSDAISTLKQARRDYKARRYSDANVRISAVADDCSTCEDGFKEKEGVISPLTNRNYNGFELSAIALSIINMLA